MRLEMHILIAVAADLVLGDPRWLPHPVGGVAWVAQRLETVTRRTMSDRAAGFITAFLTYGIVGAVAIAVIWLADAVHPLAGEGAGIWMIYAAIATRDLVNHSMAVYRPLASGDLAEARRRVAWMVGRDTQDLNEAGAARAAIESVAESTVDGIGAPLFWAVLAGPVGAVVYRAINTLDSMFGHKNDRYLRFGWAAARMDDLANYLPARITGPLMAMAALLLGRRGLRVFRVMLRDRRKHDSPNAGITEAAMAGALGVQLGGTNYYNGQPLVKPTLGDATAPPAACHIPMANVLMLTCAGLFLGAMLATRLLAEYCCNTWRST